MAQRWLLLAGPSDIPRLLGVNGETHWTWPPPGIEIRMSAGQDAPGAPDHPPGNPSALNFYGFGETTAGAPDDWWVTTLGEMLSDFVFDHSQLVANLSNEMSNILRGSFGTVLNWPVIYKAGEGEFMRWITTTFRGILGGGVEQFQHKFDWGNPGSDPDLTEAQGLAFGTTVSDSFRSNVWSAISDRVGADVLYDEVGVVQKTQTTGTGSDGTGGNLSEDWLTQWIPYPIGDKPTGSGGMTLPFEVAMAVTLMTNHRGPSGRGRTYFPPFGTTQMQSPGLFLAAATLEVGQVVGQFFEDIKANTALVPVVVSRRRIILNEIVGVEVGQVPDSQRRRRRSQDEARTMAWTAP